MQLGDAAATAIGQGAVLTPPPPRFYSNPGCPMGPNQWALFKILIDSMPSWDLPDDPFNISQWMDVLTPEQRNALEAICSR